MKPITRHNHYVPVWYQKRFLVGPSASLLYLDLDPAKNVLADGRIIAPGNVTLRSPKSCFWSTDLYTTRFGNQLNDEIENYLFGVIDNDGANAVRAFVSGEHEAIHSSFLRFFEYLGAQKLRTPKGLDWIKDKYSQLTQLGLMGEMQHLLQLNCTMWVEGVREIVSAEDSEVKFIVTDHPVTTYNAACPPCASTCVYPNDPSTALNGTQTVFALDADHCLILTNLEYAEHQAGFDLLAQRQNARHYGQTITRTDAMIRTRKLEREGVLAINYLLKARARKHIAASEKEWLFPEGSFSGQWEEIASVLRPPKDKLWHFGGEIYVGHADGSTQYQDAYGRSSGSHEYLRKERSKRKLSPNDLCGCGSGHKFKRCCEDLPDSDRPSWDVYSIRERNIMFFNAVSNILGLSDGKTWEDVRAELTDNQVSRIHRAFEGLWPTDTNLAELLPRPDKRVFRAIYMGLVDPRTIMSSVTSWTIYFDEIVVLNPFPNAGMMKREYSPVHSPAQFKAQTLKNVMLLMSLMPFIENGDIHFVPDPGEINYTVGHTMREMAKQRGADLSPEEEDLELFERLNRDDVERQFVRMPAEAMRRMISRSSPELPSDEVDRLIEHMKAERVNDPFALLQPMAPGESNGQLMIIRGMSLELALFLAQLTGSAIYTDVPLAWRELQKHTDAGPEASHWVPLTSSFQSLQFVLDADPSESHRLRSTGRFGDVRATFRAIWNALLLGQGNGNDARVHGLIAQADSANATALKEWARHPPAIHTELKRQLHLSISSSGFAHTSVQRLALTFGREKFMKEIPMAIFVSSPSQSDS